jgi:hypothetical protein
MENQNPGAQCWAALWPTSFGARPSPAGKMAHVLVQHGAVTTPRACTRRYCGALTGDAVAAGR